MSAQDIINSILAGDGDDNLDAAIFQVARERQKQVAQAQAYQLKVGDVIHISGSVSPKYLAGAPATVTSVLSSGKVKVDLDPTWLAANPRARRYNPTTVPPTLVVVP